jgi:signal transduction histidine kinase
VSLPQDFESDVIAVQSIAAVSLILDVVCQSTGMGFAAVARVTDHRWIACQVLDRIAFGMTSGGELAVETTICQEVRDCRQPVIINNVAEDAKYSSHPVPALYGFQSYISMPIMLPDGRFFGTLCAIDPRPARVKSPEIVGMFKLFAELIGFHLDAQYRLDASAKSLSEERKTAELREQFIAVLGHDLRNPLAAMNSGTGLLMRLKPDAKALEVIKLMQGSVSRMTILIENLLDFARGRLGGGLDLKLETRMSLLPVLQQVVDELIFSHPGRSIEVDWDIKVPVTCDHSRIAQLVSNLLGNALVHGAQKAPVQLRAATSSGSFIVAVRNEGDAISPDRIARLFQPFQRNGERTHREGLGLGLFIASEIARAHQGTITVKSTMEQTVFVFSMPANPTPMHA